MGSGSEGILLGRAPTVCVSAPRGRMLTNGRKLKKDAPGARTDGGKCVLDSNPHRWESYVRRPFLSSPDCTCARIGSLHTM